MKDGRIRSCHWY